MPAVGLRWQHGGKDRKGRTERSWFLQAEHQVFCSISWPHLESQLNASGSLDWLLPSCPLGHWLKPPWVWGGKSSSFLSSRSLPSSFLPPSLSCLLSFLCFLSPHFFHFHLLSILPSFLPRSFLVEMAWLLKRQVNLLDNGCWKNFYQHLPLWRDLLSGW